MRQQIRFCTAADGVRIAFATYGTGPPIVRASTWLTNLEFDWQSPIWRHWLEGLGDGHTVVRYDERGCGLSDRTVADFSLQAWVADLEAVVDAASLERFALLGISHGGPVAIAYAARHPERLSHLVLYGTYARGRLRRSAQAREEAELLVSLVRVGWGQANPAFRRTFTTLFVPEATPEQMDWFDELQRVSTSPDTAARIRRARGEVDVTALAGRVAAPTLVLHARDDAVVPVAEGRRLATLLPDARSFRWRVATTSCWPTSRRGGCSWPSSTPFSARWSLRWHRGCPSSAPVSWRSSGWSRRAWTTRRSPRGCT